MDPNARGRELWLSLLRVWVPVVYIALALLLGAWGLILAHGIWSWLGIGLAALLLLATPIVWIWGHPKTRGDRKYDALY